MIPPTFCSRCILVILTALLFFSVSIYLSALRSAPSLLTHTKPLPSPLPPSCLFFPGPWGRDLGSGPASPQPIRLTRPVLKQTSAADIVLENPVETG